MRKKILNNNIQSYINHVYLQDCCSNFANLYIFNLIDIGDFRA